MTEHDLTVIAIVISAGAALLNIILVPLAKAAARGEVKSLIEEHNNNANAHSNLDHTKTIEEAVRDLANDTNRQFIALRQEIADLRVALAPLVRRDD